MIVFDNRVHLKENLVRATLCNCSQSGKFESTRISRVRQTTPKLCERQLHVIFINVYDQTIGLYDRGGMQRLGFLIVGT